MHNRRHHIALCMVIFILVLKFVSLFLSLFFYKLRVNHSNVSGFCCSYEFYWMSCAVVCLSTHMERSTEVEKKTNFSIDQISFPRMLCYNVILYCVWMYWIPSSLFTMCLIDCLFCHGNIIAIRIVYLLS